MGFLTRCKRLFSFAFLLQNRNTFFSFFLKSFLILSEKQQRQSVRMGAENMPPDEGDVPLALTGREVIELERDLFETAVRLNDRDKRQQLFNTAQAAAEWFSLEDWITGTQEESGHRGA